MIMPDVLERLARTLQRRRERSRSYHLFVTRDWAERDTGRGYRALARLLADGYFSTVLTSDTTRALETALEEERGVSPFEYTLGETPDEQVAEVLELEKGGIHIVRLYARPLQNGQTTSASILPPALQSSLQTYFNEEMVIVGSLDQETDEIGTLLARKQGGLYYVLPRAAAPDDGVVAYLRRQGQIEPGNFLISGPDGEFNTFFVRLEQTINSLASLSSVRPGQAGSASSSGQSSSVRPSGTQSVQVAVRPSASERSISPIKLFLVLASQDEGLRQEFEAHLAPLLQEGLLTVWHPEKTAPGADRELEFKREWEAAQLILLLVSPDFFQTPQSYERAREALERHKARTAVVVPIIVRPVDWQDTEFGKLSALPRNLRAVTLWSNRDEVYSAIVHELRQTIEQLRKQF